MKVDEIDTLERDPGGDVAEQEGASEAEPLMPWAQDAVPLRKEEAVDRARERRVELVVNGGRIRGPRRLPRGPIVAVGIVVMLVVASAAVLSGRGGSRPSHRDLSETPPTSRSQAAGAQAEKTPAAIWMETRVRQAKAQMAAARRHRAAEAARRRREAASRRRAREREERRRNRAKIAARREAQASAEPSVTEAPNPTPVETEPEYAEPETTYEASDPELPSESAPPPETAPPTTEAPSEAAAPSESQTPPPETTPTEEFRGGFEK
jgi:hypothetical protein